MKKTLLSAGIALIALVMVLFTASVQTSSSIRHLYILGDSLSDIGNVFQATAKQYPPSPPYFEGRYSNGLVWVEYLASKLALTSQQTTNFAYGGASTGGSLNGIPGVLLQVDRLTKLHPQAKPDELYVLWAGANDYLYGTTAPTVPIANLTQAIDSLVAIGAQKFLIANLPDLGKLPSTHTLPSSSALSSLTTAHNLSLTRSLNTLQQQSNIQIIRLDAYALYQEAVTKTTGFTNVTEACLNNQTACKQPDQFLFWDGIHPTTAAHRVLADRAFQAVTHDQR